MRTIVLVYKLINFSHDLYDFIFLEIRPQNSSLVQKEECILGQAHLATNAEPVVFKKQCWNRCLHSLVIVLFLFISPVLIKLVNLHSHVPLLSQIKGLKKEIRTGRESQTQISAPID